MRDRIDPETYGGAVLLGVRGLAVIGHGNSSGRGIANAVRVAARGTRGRLVEQFGAALALEGAERSRGRVGSPASSRGGGSSETVCKLPSQARAAIGMERQEGDVLDREKAVEEVRAILVEQLGVDPAEVTVESSFQEDLNADSLDLVELIMEMEDRFKIKIPDEEAEKIATVGQAVDYVHGEQRLSDADGADTGLARIVMGLGSRRRRQVFTHSSWAPRREASYERLEFLGDSVLEVVVSEELMRRHPAVDEGDLSWMRQAVVGRESCAAAATAAALPEAFVAAAPAPRRAAAAELAERPSVRAALAEAVIGAGWLDLGVDATRGRRAGGLRAGPRRRRARLPRPQDRPAGGRGAAPHDRRLRARRHPGPARRSPSSPAASAWAAR